jgi:hypothetical protein
MEKKYWQLRLREDERTIHCGRCNATLGYQLAMAEPDKRVDVLLIPGYTNAVPGEPDPDKWPMHYKPTKWAEERYRRDRKRASYTDPYDPKRWDQQKASERVRAGHTMPLNSHRQTGKGYRESVNVFPAWSDADHITVRCIECSIVNGVTELC